MKIKTALLIALSALGLSAIGAAPALAAEEFHTTEATGAELFGSQDAAHAISFTGQSVSCSTVDFESKVGEKTAATGGVTPIYGGACTAFGYAATVNANGCEYWFSAKTTGQHASMEVKNCTNGGVTVLVNIPFAAKCHVLIKNQAGINGIHYENSKDKKELTIQFTSTNLHAEVLESTGLCPLKKGTHNTATYTGTTIEKGLKGGELYWE